MKSNHQPYWRAITKMAHTLIGIPDYEHYCRHMFCHHPSDKPLSKEAFYRLAMQKRFSGKGLKKCPC